MDGGRWVYAPDRVTRVGVRKHGVERHDGPTPHGGTRAEVIWVDGKVVEIVEYDARGTVIARTYAAPEESDDPGQPA